MVLSCLVWRCELGRPAKWILRRSASSGRSVPPDTDQTQNALVEPIQFTLPHETRQNSPICRGGVNWTIAIHMFILVYERVN